MTREEAIKILQEEIDGNLELSLREWRERDEQKLFPALRMAIEALYETAGDVVEVVRCKDCIYYHPSYCEIWSKYGTVQTREKGFCYMAERGEA